MLNDNIQFLNIYVGPKLERFQRKKRNLWNARCPICGDSSWDKRKARFYIYEKGGNLYCYCHNCHFSSNFSNFLKKFDQNLFQEYLFEKFKNVEREKQEETISESKNQGTDINEKIISEGEKKNTKWNEIEQHLLGPISDLSEKNPARRYCELRQIPSEYFQTLYYVKNYKKFANTICEESVFTNEFESGPRLVIPFFDEHNEPIAFQGRALTKKEKIKYLTFQINDSDKKIFGLNSIDPSKRVYIVEGPIDSMFLPNSIAVAGSDLNTSQISYQDQVFVFDNEPRNVHIVKKMKELIHKNEKVFIPPNNLEHKDINDWALENSPQKIKETIDEHTYFGLKAELRISHWKKV